jgi:DNA invertase Pin-like site-specific DNA recombinase
MRKSLDTATPAGRMVFTVLGAVAELERSLIVERVRAGMRNAKAKGNLVGRPKVNVDAKKIAALRRRALLERDHQPDGTYQGDSPESLL